MESKKEMDIADAIIDKPLGFVIGTRHFYIYPQTLGKRYLLSRLIGNLEVSDAVLAVNPTLETLRVTKGHTKDVCRIIAYSSVRTKEEVYDEENIQSVVDYLGENLSLEDMATLLMYILNDMGDKEFSKLLGIDGEQRRMSRALSVKKDSNTLKFGGKSVYGSLIDYACERYGWTLDYVVWGISYINLQLMMADSIKEVYMTEEEMRNCGLNNDKTIDISDPRAMEYIMSRDWN